MKLPSSHAHACVNSDLRAYRVFYQSANRPFSPHSICCMRFQALHLISFPRTPYQRWRNRLGFSWIPDWQDFFLFAFSIAIERVSYDSMAGRMGTHGVTGQGISLPYRSLDFFVCGPWESERSPQGKLLPLVFWFC